MTNIIIDGISNTGKTTLLKNIQQKIVDNNKYKYSNFVMSEHFTERFFENKTANISLVNKHIIDILKTIKMLNNINLNSPFSSKNIMHIYIERLFDTFYVRGLLNENFFIKNEDLLNGLSIKNILLYISKNDLEYRIKETFTTRNDIWKKYVNDSGGTLKFIDKLLREQDIMLDFNKNILSKYINCEFVNVANIDDNFYNNIM